jgi:hypothetical protein
MVVCGTAPTMKPLLDFVRYYIGASAWSTHNGDTENLRAATDGDVLELNGYRRDVARTETVISNSPRKERAKNADADMGEHVTIGKAYQIRVDKDDGHDSSFVEESRGFERQVLGTAAIKSIPETRK